MRAPGDGTVEIERFVQRARASTRFGLGPWVRRQVKNAVHRANVEATFDRIAGGKIVVLLYHKVQRRPMGLWGEPVLGVQEFERQMAFLASRYAPVSLDRAVRALRGEATLPPRAVAVTFDDGYRNNLVLAAPVLARHRIPATLFAVSGLVGTDRWMWPYELEEMFLLNPASRIAAVAGEPVIERICAAGLSQREAMFAAVDYLKQVGDAAMQRVMARLRAAMPVEVDDENRYLSWDEVRELAAYGIDVGAHTVTHPVLPLEPATSVERELVHCAEVLEREVGRRPAHFAYPYGSTCPAVTALTARNYEAAFTTVPGPCKNREALHELPRVCAPATVEELSFELARQVVFA